MHIALGANRPGFFLKEAIKDHLLCQGHELEDTGISAYDAEVPYYQVAAKVARLVATKQVDRGILVCDTGMGMVIVANKFPGVYATLCENTQSAEKARSIHNSNVLALGGLSTALLLAQNIIETWLYTEFTQSWEPAMQSFLQNSMKDIVALEAELFSKTATTFRRTL
ncbi:MAG: RpiB/LacA/LacB family sugar-phosphate isomerase [Cyanobacteria bacterium P01_F01_bin.86]